MDDDGFAGLAVGVLKLLAVADAFFGAVGVEIRCHDSLRGG
jgi:hypothetical protein